MSKKSHVSKNGSKKRYSNSSNAKTNDEFLSYYDEWGSLLPPPSILESYEEVSPGFVARLAHLMKNEQQHRHVMQKRYLSAFVFIMCFAKIISLICLSVSIGVAVFFIVHKCDWVLGLTMLISGMICFAAMSVFVSRQTAVNLVQNLSDDEREKWLNKKNAFAKDFYKKRRFFS